MKKNILKKHSRKNLLLSIPKSGSRIGLGTIMMLILVTLVLSCDRPELQTSVTTSGSVLSACQAEDKSETDTLTYRFKDGVLHITHELLLNCASSAVIVDASVSGNVITVNYTVDDNVSANCLCSKTLDYDLQNLTAGSYTLVINIDGYERLLQSITI